MKQSLAAFLVKLKRQYFSDQISKSEIAQSWELLEKRLPAARPVVPRWYNYQYVFAGVSVVMVLLVALVVLTSNTQALGKLKTAIRSALGIPNETALSPIDSTATSSSTRRAPNSQPFAKNQPQDATNSAGVGGFDILKIFEKKPAQ